LRRAFYRTWRHSPQRLRRLAVRLAIPRSPLGAAALISGADGSVLLVRPSYHRRETWTLPGGWAGRGEDLAAAARREAREELGLDVEIGDPLATARGIYGEVTVVFEGRVQGEAKLTLDAEIADARWFAPDALPPLFGPARRLVETAIRVRDRR
jgi:ADP-ribose pyrophosphatase YjhB (NUDIX family)